MKPAYLQLGPDETRRRAGEAFELLGPRRLVCPRECKVDRRADVPGLCAVGRYAVVASWFPHFGEEDCLRGRRGSGTIFFSGCNLCPRRSRFATSTTTSTRRSRSALPRRD